MKGQQASFGRLEGMEVQRALHTVARNWNARVAGATGRLAPHTPLRHHYQTCTRTLDGILSHVE